MKDVKNRFLEAISYLSKEDRECVCRALVQVEQWHEGQKRKTGEPFVIHPIATAIYLAQLECGPNTLIAGLLHDVVEDNRASLGDVQKTFGGEVAALVDAVTKLSKLRYEGHRSERQIASLRKMLLAASEDLRVLLIKLADRLHNIETIDVHRPEKRQRIARETLDIYVPFARLMGLWWMKQCFEECCFALAFPEDAAEWNRHIHDRREEFSSARKKFLCDVEQVSSIPASASLSTMTDYELYEKCSRNLDLLKDASLMDTVLLIPKDENAQEADCYRLLGDVHQNFPIRFGTLRDFIGQPLPNGYRGIHTTVFLAYNHQLRVRIQTKQMREYAQMRKYSTWAKDKKNELYRALQSLHRRYYPEQKHAFSQEYMNDLKDTVLQEKISIFTPSGEIITLPHDSTGVDLAFALSPEYLTHLSSIIQIDGNQHEVTHTLHDGDTVELLFESKGARPPNTALWQKHTHVPEAREALQQKSSDIPDEDLIMQGRTALWNEYQKHRFPIWRLSHSGLLQRQLAELCEEESFEKLLRDIGAGFFPLDKAVESYRSLLISPPSWGLRILSWLHLLPGRRALAQRASLTRLDITSDDRPGMLRDIAECVADRDINMTKVKAWGLKQGGLHQIWIHVDDFEKFSDLYDALLQLPGVKSVARTK